ncbi:hypothetical protein D5F01_LYC23835 [Larimichthys crocea]|uniref:Retropepsins domain-containing protein n=1 Tax=Larimichthys crocea TaxID=215358 RepID=A0A6G0HFV3_LARCR|nr:hypothetical protein D5F01_LYC23835 [Larimichthys crocea]
MEENALEKYQIKARTGAEKLWTEWVDQGLLANDSEAPIPTASNIMCINTAAAAARRGATSKWEKTGQKSWGPAYGRMIRARDRDVVTKAMCEIMLSVGKYQERQKISKPEKQLKDEAPVQSAAPSGEQHASMYPSLPEAPPPYAHPRGEKCHIQAPLINVKGGILDLDLSSNPNDIQLKQEKTSLAGAVSQLMNTAQQRVDILETTVSVRFLSRRQQEEGPGQAGTTPALCVDSLDIGHPPAPMEEHQDNSNHREAEEAHHIKRWTTTPVLPPDASAGLGRGGGVLKVPRDHCGLMLMADTGATYSCINTPQPLSEKSLPVIGVSGKPQNQTFTVPLTVRHEGQTLTHQFLYAPKCPVNLLGCDL